MSKDIFPEGIGELAVIEAKKIMGIREPSRLIKWVRREEQEDIPSLSREEKIRSLIALGRFVGCLAVGFSVVNQVDLGSGLINARNSLNESSNIIPQYHFLDQLIKIGFDLNASLATGISLDKGLISLSGSRVRVKLFEMAFMAQKLRPSVFA